MIINQMSISHFKLHCKSELYHSAFNLDIQVSVRDHIYTPGKENHCI